MFDQAVLHEYAVEDVEASLHDLKAQRDGLPAGFERRIFEQAVTALESVVITGYTRKLLDNVLAQTPKRQPTEQELALQRGPLGHAPEGWTP